MIFMYNRHEVQYTNVNLQFNEFTMNIHLKLLKVDTYFAVEAYIRHTGLNWMQANFSWNYQSTEKKHLKQNVHSLLYFLEKIIKKARMNEIPMYVHMALMAFSLHGLSLRSLPQPEWPNGLRVKSKCDWTEAI